MRDLVRKSVAPAIVSFLVAMVAAPSAVFAQEDDSAESAEDEQQAEASDQEEASDDEEYGPPEDLAREELEAQMKLASRTTAGISPAMNDNLAELRKIKEKLAQEPGIDEVQQAALQFYGIEQGTIKGYGNKAKTKSLAPKVTVEYRRNMVGTSIRKHDFIQYPDRVAGRDDIDGQVDEFVVGGTWNLPKLIYNPEVLELASLRKLRERVLKEVTRLYYLRRRLKIGFMLNPPTDPSTRARKQIRIDQTTAMINAITNGIFEGNEVE